MGNGPRIVVVGAGPAGLTAAYLLAKRGIAPLVLEADPVYVGGIAKTVEYRGYHFDIGGHRFFSKSNEVEDFWSEILPDDMIERPRSSRIYYRGKFFAYPIQPVEALLKLGPVEAMRCALSFARAKFRPTENPTNFEDWVVNQFGWRLYSMFFQTYTEKVWGMSCREISADWAAQRIKGLSLISAVLNALKPKPKERSDVIKTLIDSFRYPRLGPGMMWDACTAKLRELGGEVRMGRTVVGLRRADGRWQVQHRATARDGDAGGEGAAAAGNGAADDVQTTWADHVITSAPLREVVHSLEPRAPEAALRAANGLRYRDFLTVAVMVRDRGAFPDNWIYIQDGSVKVGRVQNFKSWSPEMVPDPSMACYGLEYFCFEGDGLWGARDEDLLALARSELAVLGLAREEDFVDGCVVRQKKAYPVYDEAYTQHVDVIRQVLAECYPGLHVVGRNGMHKYNNQDHSMMTSMLTVENILAGEMRYDVWRVNQDAEYIEAGTAGEEQLIEAGGRAVPRRVVPT